MLKHEDLSKRQLSHLVYNKSETVLYLTRGETAELNPEHVVTVFAQGSFLWSSVMGPKIPGDAPALMLVDFIEHQLCLIDFVIFSKIGTK